MCSSLAVFSFCSVLKYFSIVFYPVSFTQTICYHFCSSVSIAFFFLLSALKIFLFPFDFQQFLQHLTVILFMVFFFFCLFVCLVVFEVLGFISFYFSAIIFIAPNPLSGTPVSYSQILLYKRFVEAVLNFFLTLFFVCFFSTLIIFIAMCSSLLQCFYSIYSILCQKLQCEILYSPFLSLSSWYLSQYP